MRHDRKEGHWSCEFVPTGKSLTIYVRKGCDYDLRRFESDRPGLRSNGTDNFAVPQPHAPRPVKKTRWEELAVFGGDPAFSEPLHVGRPNLPDKSEFLRTIDEIWDSKILSNNGPFVQELERRFCELTGSHHAVAVCNATLGLQLVARAMELRGEIIVPSFTFIATPHAFRWEGLRPVFCDIDPLTHTIDPQCVEELISDETCAIAGVHLWGNACDSHALSELAKANGLRLVFDAAHSLGTKEIKGNQRESKVSLGDAEVYSLHATKIVSGFEGGVVVTDSDLLAHQLRSRRNFGFAGYDDVRGLGTNAKMSEVAAAMALSGMENLESLVEQNRSNFAAYCSAFEGLDGVTIQPPKNPEKTNYQYIVVRIDETEAGLSRDALMNALWAEGARARRYFFPGCHRAEPYRWECRDAVDRLPVTDQVCQEVLVLPTGASIGDEEIAVIGSLIQTCFDASRRITELSDERAA